MSIEENAVEQITVNPDQTAQVVKNEDKFETIPQLNVAVFNPSVVTEKTNKSLDDLADWKEYLHDPWKATESGEERFKKYEPVGDLSRDPLWYSMAQKYGRDIVYKTDTLLQYKDSRNMLGRIIGGYDYASDSLKLAVARKNLSDANTAGNVQRAKELENEIANLKYKLANQDRPFESEGWNSFMSVAASYARNLPEVVAVNLAGAAAAAPTAGWSVPAARMATAGIIYNDTYNLEYGNILHNIMTANPEMPEADARDRASRAANINALIEALPSLIPGLDVLGGAGKRIGEAAVKKGGGLGLKEGFKLLVQRNPEAAKQLLIGAAKATGKWGVEITSESLQELFQDMMGETAVESAVTGRDFGDVTQERLLSFIRDPFSEENADLWNTFGYTAGGVGAFEAVASLLTRGAGLGGRAAGRMMRRIPSNTEQRAVGATANRTLADRLFKHRQESALAQQSPELTDRANQAMVDRGVVPEKIYLDKDMVEQLMKDNSVQEALDKLGLPAAYEESQNNGGLIEVDFTKYDSVVNTDEALFQRIKNAVSFSPETLSLNQFQAYIASLDAKGASELEKARQSTDSFYNRVYNMMMQLHNDDKLAQAQAIQAQMIANRVGGFRLGQPRTGEDVASQIEIRLPSQQPATTGAQEVDQARGVPDLTIGGTAKKVRDLKTNETFDYTLGNFNFRASKFGNTSIELIDKDGNHLAVVTVNPKNTVTDVQVFDEADYGKHYASTLLREAERVFGDLQVHPELNQRAQDFWRHIGYTEENADKFMQRPTYTGKTITVDGKARPVENSKGEPIARTENSLTNFWRWFGDSKVVDEQGRPRVMYHGSMNKFDAFRKPAEDDGIYFGPESEAVGYGKELYAVYLSIQNPRVATYSEETETIPEMKKNGFDGMFISDMDYYIAFSPTQVKHTDNLGTWNPDDNRMLYQFVGGKARLKDAAPELYERYKKAQQMMFEGKGDDEIFKETHIHVAPDGSLRVQISDKDAKVLPDIKSKLGWKPDEKKYTMRRTAKLGEIFSHPFLFDLYPWLKDVEVKVGRSTQKYTKKRRENGVVVSMTHYIDISNDEKNSRIRQSLLHEIQHAIQDEEGWAQGGRIGSGTYRATAEELTAVRKRAELLKNMFETLHANKVITYWDASDSRVPTYRTLEPEESRSLGQVMADIAKDNPDFAKDLEELKELNKQLENYDEHDPCMKYFQLFGEAEARLTEKLSYMSQEELDALDPYQYFDVTKARIKRGRSDRGYWVSLPENQQKVGEFDVEIEFDEEDGDYQKGNVAGRFYREDDKLVIELTPDANPTTLTHELFHWFSYELQSAYNSGEMTDYWKEKAGALARMVDAKIEDGRLHLTEAQEERAADMFLEYIREGKVQNESVKPLFAYMQTLFKSVFKLIGLRQLKLNKDSEELFGAIFQAQDVIEDEQRLAGILAIEKPEDADQGLYDMYVGEMLNSRVRGTQELYKKWAVIEKFRKSEEYDRLRSETRLDVASELNQELRYIVVDEAAQHGNNAQATWMALQMNPDTADLQLSIEQVQEILDNTPDKTTEIDRITDERINAYIQGRFKITPEEMGLKASRNASKVKALLAESLMRAGKTIQDFDAAYSELLAAADAQVAKSSLHRLADSEYWNTLEARAVERYAFALANNDNKVMTETRRDQAIVNAIRMRAEAITNKARRFQETAESFRGAQKKILVKDEKTGKKHGEFKYGAYDYDLLQSILERFGFEVNYARRSQKPVAEKLDNWIMEQEATTITRAAELRNFIPFIETGHDGTFTSMTGADFEKLDAVFNAVKSVAGARYAIVLENERVLLSQMVSDTTQKFEDMGIKGFDKADGYWHKHFGTLATWTNPEPIVRALFPRKALDNVWLPFIDAAAKAELFGGRWVKRYREAKAKVNLSNKSTTYSNGIRLSNKQVADLFLSMGNEHAYENFRKSLGIEEEQAETIVSEALAAQPELANFVNEVWATYGDATSQLDKEFQERTNTLFVEKSHREFTINGIKFGGGYVPVRKQLDYVPTDVRGGNQGGMVHDKKFEKLVVAQADGNMRSIVDITENELFQSAKQGYTAVEYNNARKLLLADGMRQTIGERAFSFLDGWLTSYMMPKYDTSAWVRPLASLSSMGALGFRVSTALLQLSGLAPAAIAVGPRYFARGLHMAMKNGEWAPVYATRKGADKSDYMAVRVGDPRSSLLGQSIVDAVRQEDASTKLGKVSKYLMSRVGNAAMWGIQQVDTAVANVTWNGAYLKALDEGLSEIEARREADSVVRTVQSDSMQVSRSEGLQSQYARMFTAFATWIMAMQSQLRANIATKQFANAAVWAAAYMILSPIFESFLKEATRIGGGDDDKDYIERVLKTCYNEIASTIGTSFVPPASLGGAALTAILGGIEEGITGEREWTEVRQSNMPALQTAYRGLNAVRYGIAGVAAGDEEKLGKAATYAASTVSTEVGRLVKYLLAE